MDNNLNNIKKMYDKLTYFDQYGASLILFIIITIVIFSLISYFHVMINTQPIIEDWPNQRCKPSIMPFAGFITHPEGVSATEYTAQNFTYCIQNILSTITGDALIPVTYLTNFLQTVANDIQSAIQDIRGMFNKVRSYFQNAISKCTIPSEESMKVIKTDNDAIYKLLVDKFEFNLPKYNSFILSRNKFYL